MWARKEKKIKVHELLEVTDLEQLVSISFYVDGILCFTESKKTKEIIKDKRKRISDLNVLGVCTKGNVLIVATFGKEV